MTRISSFLDDFKVGTLLAGSGIRTLRGAKPLAVFIAIFSLPFSGVNFSRGIVNNPELGFQKDSAYEFLKNPRYNWRKFLRLLDVLCGFDVYRDQTHIKRQKQRQNSRLKQISDDREQHSLSGKAACFDTKKQRCEPSTRFAPMSVISITPLMAFEIPENSTRNDEEPENPAPSARAIPTILP